MSLLGCLVITEGYIVAYLATNLQKESYTIAVDILPEAIQSISKKYSKHVTPILADAVEFISSQEPESVNLVLANQVIQNFKTNQRLEQFISSAKRIIRLDGIIALAYFVKPRSLHPKIVRENALILSKKFILTQHFNNGNFSNCSR